MRPSVMGLVALRSYVDPARTTLDLCDVSQVHHLLFVQKISRRGSRGKLRGFQRACYFIRRPLIRFAGRVRVGSNSARSELPHIEPSLFIPPVPPPGIFDDDEPEPVHP